MSFWGTFNSTANSAVNRQVAQEKAYMAKEKFESEQNMRKAKSEDWAVIQQQQKQSQANINRMEGQKLNSDVGEYLGSAGYGDADDGSVGSQNINRLNNTLQVNPNIAKTIGINKVRRPDLNNPKDKIALTQMMTKLGVDPTLMGEEGMNNILAELTRTGFALMGDNGEALDVNEFMKMSGGYQGVTGKQGEIIKNKEDKLMDIIKTEQQISESNANIEEQNAKLDQQIALEENKQYQEAMGRLGMLKDSAVASTPSPTDVIVGKYQNGELSFEEMVQQVQKIKDKFSDTEEGQGANPLTEISTLEEEIAQAKYNKEDPEKIKKMEEELEYKEDAYNKDLFGAAAAGDEKAKRELAKRVTPAQYQDMQTFASVKDDKDLIGKFGKANDQFDVAKDANRVRNKVFDVLEKSGLDYDAIAKIKNEAGGVVNEAMKSVFDKSLTSEEHSKAYATIQATLGEFMADYIRSISGAAASDTERAYLMDVVFGGAWKDKNSLEAAMNTFVSNKSEKASNLYSDYGDRVKPNLSRERKAEMKTWSDRQLKKGVTKTSYVEPKVGETFGNSKIVKLGTINGKRVAKLENGKTVELGGK